MARRLQTLRSTAAVLAGFAALAGSGCEPAGEPPCRLAPLNYGLIGTEEPTGPSFGVGEVRLVICVRGVKPCAGDGVSLRSTAPNVLDAYRDAASDAVYYLIGLQPGFGALELHCSADESSTFDVEVR
jgi:hypothetical protein